jgi:hypothetical protein
MDAYKCDDLHLPQAIFSLIHLTRMGHNIRQATYAVKKFTSHRCIDKSIMMDINIINCGATG